MESDSGSALSSARSSLSPPPLESYPSPTSEQELAGTTLPLGHPDGTAEGEGPPPAKKRRITEPKPRVTEYLDLHAQPSNEEEQQRMNAQLERLLKVLRKKRKIVVVAGAGISVSAGSMSSRFFFSFFFHSRP
jgi:NAD-dependent histone deacetylase SIR2